MSAANVERKHELRQRSRPATTPVYEKHTQPCDENNYAPKPRNASPYPASQVGCGLARRPFPGGPAARGNGPAGEILTPENRKAAREIAEQSFVLLKNDRQILPLRKSGIIALVGSLADDEQNLLGSCRAAGDWRQAVSVRTGISNVAGSAVTILHAKGANLVDGPELRATLKAFGEEIPVDGRSPREMVAEAVAVSARADVVVAVLGESFGMSGEAASRSDIGLPESQKELLQALVETGNPSCWC